jgi:hypothetical protein
VYSMFLISSTSGARKATFLGVGNIGRDCEKDNRRLRVRGMGPFARIEVALNGSL